MNLQLGGRHRRLLTGVLLILAIMTGKYVQAQDGLYDIQSLNLKYSFTYQQVPDQLLAVNSAANTGNTGYKWQKATKPDDAAFSDIGSATGATYTPPLLTTNTWYRRITYKSPTVFYYSNTVKYEVTALGWEDLNYVREHSVLKAGKTTWETVDQLAIGDKLVSTVYYDGLGRPIQGNEKGVATPAQGSSTWGDVVQYFTYNTIGLSPQGFLPYTTTSNTGKYKADAVTVQAAYYTDTKPYSETTYEGSPLKRTKEAKAPGAVWNAAAGSKAAYQTNTLADDVKWFTVGASETSIPALVTDINTYPANSLLKTEMTDVNGKITVSFYDGNGLLILKKVQLSEGVPAQGYGTDWICTYYVYDDKGQLRCEIQPEGVKTIAAAAAPNKWVLSTTVFNEQCFIYAYDDQGRTVYKKSPGVEYLRMVYDNRDRVVFTQDGNQRQKNPAEWAVNIYDDLDRITLTALYASNETLASIQAKAAVTTGASTVSTTVAGQPVYNLLVENRVPGVTSYTAQTTVELGTGFESETGAEFVAEISPSATGQASSVTTQVYNSPLPAASLTNVVKYYFYDGYTFPRAKPFYTGFQNAEAYPAGAEAIAASKRTTGMLTGELVRVLGTGNFLANTMYYDEEGRPGQSLADNIKGGEDITTSQYQWDGRLLSSNTIHSAANSSYNRYSIVTRYQFDLIGRVTGIDKKFGGNAFKTIATYAMDDMGRLKSKRLAPGFNNPTTGKPEMETLVYSYNIQDALTGINRDYALKTAGSYAKWGNYFGVCLAYESQVAGVFTTTSLLRKDGKLSGQLWNTQGDDVQRKYEYTYDPAGRFTSAGFNQRQATGDAWAATRLNYTVDGNTGGKISYDLNGNITNMRQMGVMAGSAAPLAVDNLAYTYNTLSNKLLKVVDNGTLGTSNGRFGDFKDGSSGTAGNDYDYDANGNLVKDLNKEIRDLVGQTGGRGIRYNFLDKAEEIRVAGKGTIKIVYDADGNKLQKILTVEGSAVSKTTTYIDGFVYEETTGTAAMLSFIGHEEGRVRCITPYSGDIANYITGNISLPDGRQGVYDYYIKDQLGNVRMTLTEELNKAAGTCTMEEAAAVAEQAQFGNPAPNNEVANTRQDKPAGWGINPSLKVSRLQAPSATQAAMGPGMLLKVMAGDVLSAKVDYYYLANGTNASNSGVLQSLAASLLTTLAQPANTAIIHGGASSISGSVAGSSGLASFLSPQGGGGTAAAPQAYLNFVFFDERFEFIPPSVGEGSGNKRVSQAGDNAPALVMDPVKAPKNGFVYVYLSNASSQAVYFDNLSVSHERGRLIGEDHYYPYGLRIATLSSKSISTSLNKDMISYGYQGEYAEELDDLDLAYNEFDLRLYDPQIGRFIQADPFDQFASPYVGMGNDPVNNIDPSGGGVELAMVYVTAAAKKASSFWSVGNIFKTAMSFVPVVGSVMDIVEGVANGDVLQTVMGVAGLVADVATLGVASGVTGAIKASTKVAVTAVKGAAKQAAKKITQKGAREVTEKASKEIAEKVAEKAAKVVEQNAEALKKCKKFEGGGGCFVAGTIVLTSDGVKPIEKIVAGDSVWAYSDSLHLKSVQRVYKTIVRQVDKLVMVQSGKDTIWTTTEHPFYIGNKWIPAKNIRRGDSLTLFGGKRLLVKNVKIIDTFVTVYNFGVENFNSYYVSRRKVLVHNTNALICDPGQVGSYTNIHKSKTKYHGKGSEKRAADSAAEKAEKYDDPLESTDWTPAKNDREAFKQESRRLDTDKGGHKSKDNYNKRDSPGKKYRKQDGEL